MHRRGLPAATLVLVAALLVVVAGPAGAAAIVPPSIAACPQFPSTNVWNKRVDTLPITSNSAALMKSIGLDAYLHPDFSNAGRYGIPINIVNASTPRRTVHFQYDSESDHLGYPIPTKPLIEGGSDRHILMVDRDACRLYELFAATKTQTGWRAGSGATWDMRSNYLRTAGWTSADAAGLPIEPGLVRYPEVARGYILHALRFTAWRTCDGYIYPARHEAGDGSCTVYPPMGLRLRLKTSVDISRFGPQSRVLLTALKVYGMILADNGSSIFVSGEPNGGWDDDDLHDLHSLHGSDFVVVDTSSLRNG